MTFNPFKVLLVAGFVMVAGSGIIGIKFLTEKTEKTENLITTRIATTSSSCAVYVVELDKDKNTVSRISKERGGLKHFLSRWKDRDPEFVRSQKGCQNNFKNMYIYRGDGKKWVYSLELQQTDWFNDGKTDKKGLIDKSFDLD